MAPKKLEHPPADASAPFGGAFCVTDKQAAHYLSVSTRSIHDMLVDGRLQRVYPNPRTRRVTTESLTAYRDAILKGERPPVWPVTPNPQGKAAAAPTPPPAPEPQKKGGLLARWGLGNGSD